VLVNYRVPELQEDAEPGGFEPRLPTQ